MSTRKFKKALIASIEKQISYWEKHIADGIELSELIKSQLQQLSAIAPEDAYQYQWCLEV